MHSSHARRNIRLLYAFWVMREFQLWIPVWMVFLIKEQGFSLTEVTTCEGLFLVGVVLLEVPTGAVADRWGRSRSMALGAIALSAAVGTFAFTTSFSILLASFLMWSLATALISGADMAILFDSLKAEGRESAYERLAGRGIALTWAGAGFATLLGGPVAAVTGIRATIIFGSVTCLLTASVAMLMWEAPRTTQQGSEQGLGSIGQAVREVWAAPDLRAVILLAGTTVAALAGSHYLVQPLLLDRGVEVGVWFSVLQVPTLLAGMSGALLAHRLIDRVGAVWAMLMVPAAGAVAYFVLAASPGLSGFAMVMVLFGAGSCIDPIAGGYINRRVASERRATILSIQGMVSSLLLAAISPGLGYITDRQGLGHAFTAGGLATLVALAAFGIPVLMRSRGREQRAVEASTA